MDFLAPFSTPFQIVFGLLAVIVNVIFVPDIKRRIGKYQIDWKDGDGVRKYVAELKETYITKILDEHYFRHPVSRVLASPGSEVETAQV